jgi:tRNA threonylcarbamoyladenosine biosynthesis protein TsaE
MGSNSLDLFLRDRSCTEKLGYLLGRYLPSQSVILLRGELGAGKTTLIQGLGKGLGITEAIASPTFTLVNEYTEGRLPLYHLDLYRLDKEQVGGICPEIYWEGLEVEPGITAIEWSERLPYKPDCYWEINLVHNAKRGRQATINLIGQHDLNLDFLISLASTTVD